MATTRIPIPRCYAGTRRPSRVPDESLLPGSLTAIEYEAVFDVLPISNHLQVKEACVDTISHVLKLDYPTGAGPNMAERHGGYRDETLLLTKATYGIRDPAPDQHWRTLTATQHRVERPTDYSQRLADLITGYELCLTIDYKKRNIAGHLAKPLLRSLLSGFQQVVYKFWYGQRFFATKGGRVWSWACRLQIRRCGAIPSWHDVYHLSFGQVQKVMERSILLERASYTG